MANHGVISLGKDVMEAYYRMEMVEHFARILLTAIQLGHVNILGPERIDQLTKIREKFGLSGVHYACDPRARVGGAETGLVPDARKESR